MNEGLCLFLKFISQSHKISLFVIFLLTTWIKYVNYEFMTEMTRHTAGRIYLLALLLSIVGFIAFLVIGGTGVPASGVPTLLFGWMTMPLVLGVAFVGFWLVTYIVYFFFFWPYR